MHTQLCNLNTSCGIGFGVNGIVKRASTWRANSKGKEKERGETAKEDRLRREGAKLNMYRSQFTWFGMNVCLYSTLYFLVNCHGNTRMQKLSPTIVYTT